MADAQTITFKVPPMLARGLKNPDSVITKRFSQGIEKSIIIAQGEVKKNVTPGWGAGFRKGIFSGALMRSITYRMDSPLKGILGVNKVYARIQEKGGTIVPRIARALFVPLSRRGRREGPTKGGGSKLKWGIDFILTRKVTIKAKHYFKRGVQKAVKRIDTVLKKTVRDITRDMGFK